MGRATGRGGWLWRVGLAGSWALGIAAVCGPAYGATTCADLGKLALPQAKVVRAEEVAAGQFALPGQEGEARAQARFGKMPAFCRVVVQMTPSADSDIKAEVWMPAAGWNGKFRGQGNGGFAGEINYDLMAGAVRAGYATAGTDTGHTGGSTDASWALGHPEKVIDFGYRGIHEMTVKARLVVNAYYGKTPERSYFASCSDGGREALMEAQRFPADYDGILAGAPAYAWTNLVTSGVHKMQALNQPGSYIPAAKVPALAAAVNAACDAADGVKDGVLNDPRQCRFKPESLLCKAAETEGCLTAPQVKALAALYGPTLDSKGREVYPASLPGGEDGPGGWATWVVGESQGRSLGTAFGTGYFSNMVYGDPHWSARSFEVDAGLKKAQETTGAALNATSPDLKAFAGRGGKLILYHGWNDPAISPLSTVAYYQQVQKTNADAGSFVRLFMVPGMQHCFGGPGATSFGQFGYMPGTGPDDAEHDAYAALEGWVEKGTAPQQFIAAKVEGGAGAAPQVTMTRPLCAYPLVVQYKGSGDPNEAANFRCAVAPK